MLRVDVLDGTLTKQAEITDYQLVSTVSRSTKGGAFQLDLVQSGPSQLLLDTAGAGVRIVDTTTDFVGIVTGYDINVDVGGTHYVFTGIDHLARLDWRRTGPQPGTAAPPYSTSAYSTYTGTVTEVIADMVDDRCGAAALPARQFLTVEAPTAAGPTITVNLRFRSTLAEVVDSLCVAYGMACAVSLEAGGLVFRVWESVTRTNAPVGPEIGGLNGYLASGRAPAATDVLVGGQGELTARTFAQSTTTSTRWPWLIETYAEHTEIDNATDLGDAADELLTESAEQVAFTADIATYETDSLRFGTDFGLGDLLPLRLGGQEIVAPITAVTTEVGDVNSRKLTVGYPPAKGVPAAISKSRQADLTARRQRGL